MIFSRRRGNAGRHTAGARQRADRGPVEDDDLDVELDDEADPATEPPFGPYDVSEAPDDGQDRLDFGALRIPAIAGIELHFQTGPDGEVQQVMLAHENSRLQLGAFAAPRTEGIWDEVRAMLRTSMAQNGARQEDSDGDYGPELKARLRDGTSTVDLRHIGVDGPRWFLHAVFIGEAAADPSKAGPLLDALRGVVVDRGTDARPVREPLPLRLPPEIAAQAKAAQADHEARTVAGADAPNGMPTGIQTSPRAGGANRGDASARGQATARTARGQATARTAGQTTARTARGATAEGADKPVRRAAKATRTRGVPGANQQA